MNSEFKDKLASRLRAIHGDDCAWYTRQPSNSLVTEVHVADNAGREFCYDIPDTVTIRNDMTTDELLDAILLPDGDER